MIGKRTQEGYLLVDNTASGGTCVETATITCAHCHLVVLLNPNRSRPRHYCRGCDHYICDGCAEVQKVTLQCANLRDHFDDLREAVVQGEQAERGTVLVVPPVIHTPGGGGF